MERLLCGVDFSGHSGRALAFGLTLAKPLGASVSVVTVVDPLLAEAANVEYGLGQFTESAERDLDTFIRETAGPSATGPRPALRVVVGDPGQMLLEVAEEERATIIVVGTHGLGPVKRFMFGSTTLRLLQTTDRPILAVPPDAEAEEDGPFTPLPAPRKIICGIDLSESSKAAARLGASLASRLSLPFSLVHAVPAIRTPSAWHTLAESGVEPQRSKAEAALNELSRTLGPPHPDVRVRRGDAAEVLAAEAGPEDTTILLLGLGAHRPGSSTYRILTESRAPVIAVPDMKSMKG